MIDVPRARAQTTNHFPGSWALGRKDRLSRNMARMRREHGRAYDFYAQTFHLPAERDKFRAELDKDPRQAWILKPAASSCGRGIKLCTRAAGVMLPRSKKYIAQKYIDRPLLVDGCAPACSCRCSAVACRRLRDPTALP